MSDDQQAQEPNAIEKADEQARGRVRLSEMRVKPGVGIVVETGADLHTFANYAAQKGLAPLSYRRKDGSWDTPAMTIALIKGMEVGMKPTQALQNIAVINNTPTIYGDAVPGLAFATGQVTHFHEYMTGTEGEDDWTAVCELSRRGMDQPLVTRFSVADAKKAGLWGKTTYNGKPTPWVTYPGRMLTWRARSWNFRAVFGDVLKGLGIYEEVIDVPVQAEADGPTEGQEGLLRAVRGLKGASDTHQEHMQALREQHGEHLTDDELYDLDDQAMREDEEARS